MKEKTKSKKKIVALIVATIVIETSALGIGFDKYNDIKDEKLLIEEKNVALQGALDQSSKQKIDLKIQLSKTSKDLKTTEDELIKSDEELKQTLLMLKKSQAETKVESMKNDTLEKQVELLKVKK